MSSYEVIFAVDTCFLIDTFKGEHQSQSAKWIKFFDQHIESGGNFVIIPAIVWSELSVCEEAPAMALSLGAFEILPFDKNHAERSACYYNAIKLKGDMPPRANGVRQSCMDEK